MTTDSDFPEELEDLEPVNIYPQYAIKHCGFTASGDWPFTRLFNLLSTGKRAYNENVDFTFNRTKGTDYFYPLSANLAGKWVNGYVGNSKSTELIVPETAICSKLAITATYQYDESVAAKLYGTLKAAKIRSKFSELDLLQINSPMFTIGTKTSDWLFSLTRFDDLIVAEFEIKNFVGESNELRLLLTKPDTYLSDIWRVLEIRHLGYAATHEDSKLVLDITNPVNELAKVKELAPNRIARTTANAIIKHYHEHGVDITETVIAELRSKLLDQMGKQLTLPEPDMQGITF
jgi:hypothetical protein